MKKLIGSQIFRYVITGGFTTVVDYIIYIGLTALEVNYLAANTAAWAGAVIFAFSPTGMWCSTLTGTGPGNFSSLFPSGFAPLLRKICC